MLSSSLYILYSPSVLLLQNFFLLLLMCICLCLSELCYNSGKQVSTETGRGNKFPGAVITGSCELPMWVLVTEHGSSARASSTLN